MNTEHPKRCPHYQIYSERLDSEGPPSYLAIRHCLLAERLIRILRQTQDGALLAGKLIIRTTEGKTFAFAGPDLEAVTQLTCTVERCEMRCTPAYAQNLEHFDLQDPGEEEVTCEEAEEETERADVEAEPSSTETFSS